MFTRQSKDRFSRQLKAMPEAAVKELLRVNEKSAKEFEVSAKALVPVLTGETKLSIEAGAYRTEKGVVLTMTAGDVGGAPARAVEFVNQQYFFYPTVRLMMKRWRGRAKRALNKAAKDAARK